MLHSTRKRREDFAAREAAGENLWTEDLDSRVLVRLDAIWEHLEVSPYLAYVSINTEVARTLREEGGYQTPSSYGAGDLVSHAKLGNDFLLDILSAIAMALEDFPEILEEFTDEVNAVLNEHRIAFRFVGANLLPRSSDELDQGVVEPALKLLINEKFSDGHASYLAAIRAIQHNDPKHSTTLAGTALQSTLTSLGYKGNALGPLIKDARNKGLLAPHDQKLADGLVRIYDWVSADRSESGDNHKNADSDLADAWLMVHVVGALIVRLTEPGKTRGGAS